MIIRFQHQDGYNLAAAILAQSEQRISTFQAEAERQIDVKDMWLGELVEQCNQQQSAIIPIFSTQSDHWLVAGVDRHAANQTFARVTRFILPTYGSLPDNSPFPIFRQFIKSDSVLMDTASRLFAGYYEWLSPPQERRRILQRLVNSLQLAAHQPSLKPIRRQTYAELYAKFNSSLAAFNWSGAEHVLAEMQACHLTTAENLVFLQVQLWACKQDWDAVWNNQSYSRLAKLSLPRAVRTALITAFHHCVLLEPEVHDDVDEALNRFRIVQPKLGSLLNGRFELADSAVIRVFGYQAVLTNNRQDLKELQFHPKLDEPTRRCLYSLAKILPSEAPRQISAVTRLQQAMTDRDYDAAVVAADELREPAQKVRALLEVAIHHQDAAQPAYRAFQSLPLALQHQLLDEPIATLCWHRVQELVRVAEPTIATWNEWFEKLFHAPDQDQLMGAIEQLSIIEDDRDLTIQAIHRLSEQLSLLAFDRTELLEHSYIRRAVSCLIDLFLKDQQFPRKDIVYRELYEALYACLLFIKEISAENSVKVIRLAEELLRQDLGKLASIYQDLRTWFVRPNLKHEPNLLDTLEMLVEYGLPREQLMGWYREWLSRLLDSPATMPWDRVNQQVWLSLGEWLQPGDDLLIPLRQRLTRGATAREVDPLLALGEKFQIGIFTLRCSSGERARDLLLQRNPELDIRICAETDMNGQALALARNCNVAVVVTTCLTHAITYGITPHLRQKPIYPDSQGSSSIVRAIEAFATSQS